MNAIGKVTAVALAFVLSGTLIAQLSGQKKEAPLQKSEPRSQRLTMDVAGVDSPASADMLADALNGAGLKVERKLSPGKGNVARVAVLAREDLDLAPAAMKVNSVATAHREQWPPGLSLVLFAKLDEASAGKAIETLGKIKGIDRIESKADTLTGEVVAKLTGATETKPAADGAGSIPPANKSGAAEAKSTENNFRAPAPAGHKLTANMIVKMLNDAGISARTESSLQITADTK